jgi:hypothetical protein
MMATIQETHMTRTLALLILGFVPFSATLAAHHSGSWADSQNPKTVTGTVTEFTFTNPHVLMTVAVKTPAGDVEKWIVEFNSPQSLRRSGVNAATIKPGDEVTISGSPAKDGRKMMASMGNRKFTINGKEIDLRRGGASAE